MRRARVRPRRPGFRALCAWLSMCLLAHGDSVRDPRIALERRPNLPRAPSTIDQPRYVMAPGELTGLKRQEWLHSHRTKQQHATLQRLRDEHKAQPQRPLVQRCDAHGSCHFEGVQVSMQNSMGLVFCIDCPDPHLAGSYIDTWEARPFPDGFHVHGELIVGVPNDGSSHMHVVAGGTIVLFKRGGVPFVEKVKHAQAAGAVAVVVMDDGRCDDSFHCDHFLGSKDRKQYFAETDSPGDWEHVFIPAVLISQSEGHRLLENLRLASCVLDEHGKQVYVPDL